MTAVEFLHSKYIKIFGELNPSTGKLIEIGYAIEQAKEMEKEQMIKFAEKMRLIQDVDFDGNVTFVFDPRTHLETFKSE